MTLVDHYGPIILFVSLMLETQGLSFPCDRALILTAAVAGTRHRADEYLASRHRGVAGCCSGRNIAYFIGRRFGRQVLLTYGARVGITESWFARVEAVIARYGSLLVIAARFIVLLRQLNGLVAGSVGMRWLTFFLSNAVGPRSG